MCCMRLFQPCGGLIPPACPTAGYGKPYVPWCGRLAGAIPSAHWDQSCDYTRALTPRTQVRHIPVVLSNQNQISSSMIFLARAFSFMSSRVPADYEFEAFVSYSHSGVVRPWVLSFLGPHLQEWLPHYTGGQPARVFIDKEEIDEGVRWPQYVRDSLRTSKCLVCVLSGDYFFKPWCISEWTSFVERENSLGLDITSHSLVIPVVHSDGKFFPARANEYQPFYFNDCRSNSANFQNHPNFPIFEEKVEQLAAAVAATADRAPSFNPDWRVLKIDPVRRTVPLMRIP